MDSRFTLGALRQCNPDDLLSGITSHDSTSISRALRGAVRTPTHSDEVKVALDYLARLIDIGFMPRDPSGPYRPMWSLPDGSRSMVPADLREAELSILATYVREIQHPALIARINDCLWIQRKDPSAAHEAVRGFTAYAITKGTWTTTALSAWWRALQICRELGKGGLTLLQKHIETIRAATISCDASSRKLLHGLGTLLETWDRDKQSWKDLAHRLANAARERSPSEPHWERECLFLASRLFQRLNEQAESASAVFDAAKTYSVEADERRNRGGQSHLTTGHLYLAAIETLRQIPHSQRDRLGVDEEISKLRDIHRQANAAATELMGEHSGEKIDISDLVHHARRVVRLSDPWKALRAFVMFLSLADKVTLFQQARENAHEFMFMRLASQVQYTRDGRISAHTPAMPFESEESKEAQAALHADVVRSMQIHRGLHVDGGIMPAMRTLHEVHQLERSLFNEIADKSSIVPRDRRGTVARGLWEGYLGDFGAALYLLVPQLEHIVRTALQAAGAHTTTLEAGGVENEKGLTALMDTPEAAQVFGENLAFEIRVLFCDSLGPNLRNNAAHGLLSDGEAYSHETIYAWWFILRMVMIPIINASSTRDPRFSRMMSHGRKQERKARSRRPRKSRMRSH